MKRPFSRALLLSTVSIMAVWAVDANALYQPPDTYHTVPPSLSEMHLTFDDEFSGATLDHSKWVTHYPFLGYINNEQESYVPDAIVPDPVDGVLRIRSDVRSYNGRPYTSGVISTHNHFSQTYGYYEMRAKMPHTTGFWPAFWLFSEYGTNPYAELDILEHYTVAPTVSTHNWHISVDGVMQNGGLYFTNPVDLSAGYHTYGLSWQPNLVIYYVDGKEVNRITGDLVPTQPLYMMANVAIGEGFRAPNATTTFPNTMDIDYIRVYQFNNSPPEYVPPVKLLPVQLSSYNLTPGQTLTVTESLVVGPKDIPNANILMGIADYNGNNVTGLTGIDPYYAVLKAGTTVTQSHSFVIPATLPTGLYNIDYKVVSNYQAIANTTVAEEFMINNPKVPGSGPLAIAPLTTKPLPAVIPPGTPAPGTAVIIPPTVPIQPAAIGADYSLGATTISATTAKAGDKLTVTGTVIAKKDIDAPFDVQLLIIPDEPTTNNALTALINATYVLSNTYLNTPVKVPAMKAGEVQEVSINFTVPSKMPAGKYDLETWGRDGLANIVDKQLNKLTITK